MKPKVQISVKLENLDKLEILLKSLPSKIRLKILRSITLHGARLFKPEVIARAPTGNYKNASGGKLRDSIVVRRGRPQDSGWRDELARVIVSRRRHKVFYAHLVEFGHKIVIRRNHRTIYVGQQPPSPFMLPAFESKKEFVSRDCLRLMKKKVLRLANKEALAAGLKKYPRGYLR